MAVMGRSWPSGNNIGEFPYLNTKCTYNVVLILAETICIFAFSNKVQPGKQLL